MVCVPAATWSERYDGFTEVWSYAEFPVDSIAEVFAAGGYRGDQGVEANGHRSIEDLPSEPAVILAA